MPTYIAESLAAYGLIADYKHHPNTDEGWGVSGPVTVATGDDETMVRHELAMHLIKSGGRDEAWHEVHVAASNAIVAGVDAVQISGRVYRIREEA